MFPYKRSAKIELCSLSAKKYFQNILKNMDCFDLPDYMLKRICKMSPSCTI